MDEINGSKFLIGEDGKDPFNYDDMHDGGQQNTTPTLEGDVFVSEEEKEEATSSKDDTKEEEQETSNDMGSSSIMLLALLLGAFLFMRKK